MREPSLRTSRLAIAGALVAAALVGGAGFYLGRTTSAEPENGTRSDPVLSPAPLPAVSTIVADSVLGRAEVIELAAAAADAAASGAILPDQVRAAVGRRFELALPFGCTGPAEAESEQPLRWRYDEAEQALRLHVAVTRWEAGDWGLEQLTDEDAAGDEASDDQAIEGFWIARPWSLSAQCPARATAAQPAVAAEESLAIAQFFRGDGRREALREGRPFQSVQRIPRTDFAAPNGFRLMLSGRIGRVPTAESGPGGTGAGAFSPAGSSDARAVSSRLRSMKCGSRIRPMMSCSRAGRSVAISAGQSFSESSATMSIRPKVLSVARRSR
jgi:hypothetical protein